MARRILVIGVSGGLHYNEILSGVLMGYFSARGMGEMTYVGQKRSMPDFFSQLAAKRKAMRITLADFPWETLPEYDVIITLGQTGSYEVTIDDKGPRRFAFPPSPDNMSDAQVRAVTEHDIHRIHVLFEAEHAGKKTPQAWVKSYGEGRVAYIAPGHNLATFLNPSFLKVVERSTLWATREI